MSDPTAGSYNAQTGDVYAAGLLPGQKTPEGLRWEELQAEFAKKAADQFFAEFPDAVSTPAPANYATGASLKKAEDEPETENPEPVADEPAPVEEQPQEEHHEEDGQQQ